MSGWVLCTSFFLIPRFYFWCVYVDLKYDDIFVFWLIVVCEWVCGVLLVLGWAELGWAELGWAGLGWAGLGWAGLGWAGLGWAGLGWAGLGWAGLGSAGLGWVGLG